MPLSWNEIKDRALNFSRECAEISNEEEQMQNLFGISSKRVSAFEHRVKN